MSRLNIPWKIRSLRPQYGHSFQALKVIFVVLLAKNHHENILKRPIPDVVCLYVINWEVSTLTAPVTTLYAKHKLFLHYIVSTETCHIIATSIAHRNQKLIFLYLFTWSKFICYNHYINYSKCGLNLQTSCQVFNGMIKWFIFGWSTI